MNSFQTNEERQIELLQEYITLMDEELQEITFLAWNHGWRSSRFEKGKRLRERMAKVGLILNTKGEDDG